MSSPSFKITSSVLTNIVARRIKNSKKKIKIKDGLLAAIVIGALALVAIPLVILIFLKQKKSQAARMSSNV
jgi:hypothetical protein